MYIMLLFIYVYLYVYVGRKVLKGKKMLKQTGFENTNQEIERERKKSSNKRW